MHALKLQLHLFSSLESPMHDDCIDLDLTYACATREDAVKVAADMARGLIQGKNSEWSFIEIVEVVSRDGDLHVITGFCDNPHFNR